MQVGALQVGALQADASQVGASQVVAGQVGVVEVGADRFEIAIGNAVVRGRGAIQLNASIKGRRQALIDAGVKLTAGTWRLKEPRRGVMAL